MRIRKVEARAFGPLEGQELELASGMNVVYGPNESGKSTWHGALYAGLCGMRRGRGRARTEDQDFTDSHRPWNLDRWEVAAVVELGDGRTLELRHDLDGKVDSRITDLGTGADVSADCMHDGAPDGAALLGLARDVLPSTVFVRQADILAVAASGDNLQEQLQRAASTSGQDATAQEALGLIESFRSEEVGSTVRHSTKPLRVATVRREQCERELASAREQHEEYLRLLHDAQEAEEAAEHARRVLGVARALKGREEVAERERRLKRAEGLARDLPAERPPPRTGPTAEVEELRQALSNFKERPEPRPVLDGRSAEEIQRELGSLPEPPSGDTEVHDSVARAFEQWRDRAVALETSRSEKVEEPEQPVEDVDPSELRRLADALQVSLPDVDPDLRRQVEAARAARAKGGLSAPLLIGAALVVAGVALVVVGQQAVGFVLLAAGAAALALSNVWKSGSDPDETTQLEARLTLQEEARRQAEVRRQNSLDRLEALELGDSPQELRRLAQRIDRAEIERSRRKEWEARVRLVANAFEEAEQVLRDALVERGIVEAEDSERQPDDLVEHYKRHCRVRSEQARLASRRRDLESEFRTRQSAEDAHEVAASDRAEARSRLQRAAEAVGIFDAEDCALPAETWLKQDEAREERNNTLRERWAELDGVLEGDTLEELREEVDLRKANLPPLPEDWEQLGGPELLDRFARIEQEAQEKDRLAAELHGRVSDRGRNLPSVPAAEEALEKAEQELRRVRRLDETLGRTHEFLSNAREQVQRLISPRLKNAVERRLPAITAGRYTEALVDPDSLEVKVRGAGGDWRPASRLSHGTTEQIYLLLRIGLVEFIATTGEPAPLILDDVTVQCDSARTEALLEMLHELSLERQIVVFSQEQQVLDWARRELGSERDKLVELDTGTIAA